MSLERVLRNSKFIYFLKDVKQIQKKKPLEFEMGLEWVWRHVGERLNNFQNHFKFIARPQTKYWKNPKLSPNSNIFSKQLFEQATKRKNTHKQWLEFGPSLEWVCSEFGTQNSFFPRKTGKEKKPENKTSLHRVWSEFAQSHFFQKRVKRNPKTLTNRV